jgi:hypothetical protein
LLASVLREKTNAYKVLVGKSEAKRPLKRPRHRWENNVEMDLKEIGWDGGNLINLAQYGDNWCALVTTVVNVWAP